VTPRWPEDEPRHDCRVEVRATSQQEAAWRKAAKRSTLSQWIRETLDRAANQPTPGEPGSEDTDAQP
jgi:hypothetical protein